MVVMKKRFQIAIDGPAAAGKGAVSRRLAKKLKLLYVDSGAMYRVATLLALKEKKELGDENGISEIIAQAKIEIPKSDIKAQKTKILVNGEDVSKEIRSRMIADSVARVAALPKVRSELVKKQQKIAENNDVVMEGRDIASVVLPKADLKIYLDAREEVRVERRYKELIGEKKLVSREEVERSLRARDKIDREREASPLTISEKAWYLDASDLTIKEVVDLISKRVEKIRRKKRL